MTNQTGDIVDTRSDLPAFGLFLHRADGFTLTNVELLVDATDARKAIETRDVSGLSAR